MGFFGNNRCRGNNNNRRYENNFNGDCRNREMDCYDRDYDREDCHKEERCEERRCRPCCMDCTIRRKQHHCPQNFCNSYPEQIHEECDQGFEICCW